MKLAALAFLSVVPAAMAQPVEARVEGAAAESYDRPIRPETEVNEEHGGTASGNEGRQERPS